MSATDITLRQRKSRPKHYLYYTPFTDGVRVQLRNEAKSMLSKQVKPKVSVLHSPLSINQNNAEPTKKSVATDGFQLYRNSIAMRAVEMADPSYSEIEIDRLSVLISRDNAGTKKILSRLLYTFGVLVFVASLAVSIQTYVVIKPDEQQVQALGEQTYLVDQNGVSEGSGSDPAETVVSEDALFSYIPRKPDDPRYIRIPSVGIISRVKALGINEGTGTVDAPSNVHDSGWYDGSVTPGSGPGTSLILGHVSGSTTAGVFKNIETIKKDDKVIIENGEGRTFTYFVYKTETVDINNFDTDEVLGIEETDEHVVKLMTYAGEFNSATEDYDSRTIVYARQIK